VKETAAIRSVLAATARCTPRMGKSSLFAPVAVAQVFRCARPWTQFRIDDLGAPRGVRGSTAEAPQSWACPSWPVQQTSPQISPMARNFDASCRRVHACPIALKAAGTVADILAG